MIGDVILIVLHSVTSLCRNHDVIWSPCYDHIRLLTQPPPPHIMPRTFTTTYDFLGRIMRPRSFRAIEMDTDSFYMALTENDLYECFNEVAKSQMQENAKH